VAHNYHGKSKTLTAKTKSSRQKQKAHGKNKKPTAKAKKLTAKTKSSRQKQKAHGKNPTPHVLDTKIVLAKVVGIKSNMAAS